MNIKLTVVNPAGVCWHVKYNGITIITCDSRREAIAQKEKLERSVKRA